MSLTHEDAMRIHSEAPGRLAQLALASREAFAFEPRDLRGEGPEIWGGELRVCLNQNVVLHFVPRFNDEMRSVAELPQFVVMPDDDREGVDEVHRYEAEADLDPFDGVVFWVGSADYAQMREEMADAAESFPGRCLLPDVLYGGSRFVRFVRARVLEHPVVADERPYDFTKRTF